MESFVETVRANLKAARDEGTRYNKVRQGILEALLKASTRGHSQVTLSCSQDFYTFHKKLADDLVQERVWLFPVDNETKTCLAQVRPDTEVNVGRQEVIVLMEPNEAPLKAPQVGDIFGSGPDRTLILGLDCVCPGFYQILGLRTTPTGLYEILTMRIGSNEVKQIPHSDQFFHGLLPLAQTHRAFLLESSPLVRHALHRTGFLFPKTSSVDWSDAIKALRGVTKDQTVDFLDFDTQRPKVVISSPREGKFLHLPKLKKPDERLQELLDLVPQERAALGMQCSEWLRSRTSREYHLAPGELSYNHCNKERSHV